MFKAQWRRVQYLANTFWQRWRAEYLSSLQKRRKWPDRMDNIEKGDVVLVKDKVLARGKWPTGVVINAIRSQDNQVRKVELKISKLNETVVRTRPITDLVLLVKHEQEQ